MEEKENKTKLSMARTAKLMNCGFLSGLLQAGVFNPWDRALYLSIRFKRPFLNVDNFKNPMAGVLQTITQRAISAGCYFPLEQIFSELLRSQINSLKSEQEYSRSINFFAGLLAGSTNGIILNPFSAIKYRFWLKEGNGHSFISTAAEMLRKRGIKPFLVGSKATISRDLVFGSCFALVRHELLKPTKIKRSKTEEFLLNMFSATLATILSSPFNYVRNIQYSTPPEKIPHSIFKILSGLWKKASCKDSWWESIKYVQFRLRIGWGTARVGCGMAFGAYVYEFCSNGVS